MGRTKGMPKTGGRIAGTPNKVTEDMKVFILDVLEKNRKKFKEDLEKLSPKDRVDVYVRLMQFVVPKQLATGEDKGFPSEIRIRYIGKEGEEIFPSSEDEVDMTRQEYPYSQ